MDIAPHIITMELALSLITLRRLQKALKSSEVLGSELLGLLDEFYSRVKDEMDSRLFLSLSVSEKEYFEPEELLFGDVAADKLVSATFDIEETGKCYAVGRYTACVFHVMRVMEDGIQQFAALLGVDILSASGKGNTWGSIEAGIGKKLDSLQASDPSAAKYSAIRAYFHAIRIAWRNETMHPKATYTQEETSFILNAVRSFITELVTVL